MTLSTLGAAHLTSAFVALVLGAVVVLERKGTSSHRMMGAGYVLAMVLVNLTALGLYRLTGRFGPFHLLALVSLATVVWGMQAVLRRCEGWLHSHYYSMAWSYVGLLAAACAEGVLRVPLLAALINTPTQAIGLGVTIAVLFTILGALVVPRLQARAFASLD
jgi:uncharacterized membrane protein